MNPNRGNVRFDGSLLFLGVCAFIGLLLLYGFNSKFRIGSQRAALADSVQDGQLILVRNDKQLGGFIVMNQRETPELLDFKWFVRDDKVPSLDPNDPAVSSGTITNATWIRFGSFNIQWSIAKAGYGWVYYPNSLRVKANAAAHYEVFVPDFNDPAVLAEMSELTDFKAKPDFELSRFLGGGIDADKLKQIIA